MSYAADVWAPAEAEITTTLPAEEIVPMMPSVPLAPDSTPVAADIVFDEDSELLDRLAAGDEVAFRMLVERHIDRAYAIALRIVGNAADAEDVVQDTMLKIWSHRGRWQHGRAKFSTWLYRVITNRCIDLRRKPRNENVETVPEVADGQPDAVEHHRAQRAERHAGARDAAPARAAAHRGDLLLPREHEQRRDRRGDGHHGGRGGVAC